MHSSFLQLNRISATPEMGTTHPVQSDERNRIKPVCPDKNTPPPAERQQDEPAAKRAGNETWAQTRTISNVDKSLNAPPESFLQWLKPEKSVENPSMELAEQTLKKVREHLKEHDIKIANWITPEDLDDPEREKTVILYNTIAAEHRLKLAQTKSLDNPDTYLQKLCQIPTETHGTNCYMAAMLAYRELYQQQEITPLILGFRYSERSHAVACIFHGRSAPVKGEFVIQGSVEELGENIHIIDPWFDISCSASSYPALVQKKIDSLRQHCVLSLSMINGELDINLSPFINLATPKAEVRISHFHTHWKEVMKEIAKG